MTMGYSVITISRQYGSGGREIEAQLAERLGIPFYDKTLCAEAAKHSRLDADFLEQAEKALWDTARARTTYLKDDTGQVLGEAENCHLCLDSGLLGLEHTVRTLEAVFQTEHTEKGGA